MGGGPPHDGASMKKPRLLDLFCGAGGASVGYHRAGFEVVGVDIKRQPNYPFPFILDDVLHLLGRDSANGEPLFVVDSFDAIHASPPCQAYTLHNGARDDHPNLIGSTRELLEATGLPYVIENVPGAPLLEPFKLCGSSFGLGAAGQQLRRHRYFETNWPMGMLPPCAHQGRACGIYGDHFRLGRRSSYGELSGAEALAHGGIAMGIDWPMTWDELKEAIPPAFTEYIGTQLLLCMKGAGVSGF